MNSTDKLFAFFWVCVLFAILTIVTAVCMHRYMYHLEIKTALEAGYIQKVDSARNELLWVKE